MKKSWRETHPSMGLNVGIKLKEAEIVRQRVSIADRKVFARPESFCEFNEKRLIVVRKFP